MKFKIYLAIVSAFALSASSSFATAQKAVKLASPWEITSFDLSVSGYAIQKLQIMENLVDADEKGTLLPGLATEWSASDNGLEWVFVLRRGVLFHDNTPFNAAAAVQALNRAWKKPGVLSKAPVAKISAQGGNVVFALKRPFAALPAVLAHATTIIPAPSAVDGEGRAKAFIGTGPFQVAAFTPPQSMDLVRNDSYWGEAPSITAVEYLTVGRAETRALLAESNDAHMVFTLDPAGFARLQNVEHVRAVSVPIPRVVTLKVNAGHPFFQDVQARQALSLAIDRAGIAAAITRFPEAAARQLFPPVLGKWHDPSLAPLAYNTKKAKALLADLGWIAGSDGILVRNGERFSILLRTFPDRPELPLMAAAIQDQWKKIGVELKVSIANYSEIPAGHQDGTLHVALYARNYSLTPDPIGTLLQDFSAGGADWGAMGWTNAEVDSALQTIAGTSDQEIRNTNIARVVQILHKELPIIPIGWYQHTVSITTDLHGVVIDPLQRSYGLSKVSWKK